MDRVKVHITSHHLLKRSKFAFSVQGSKFVLLLAGKGILFNVGGQTLTGKDCLLTWADGVKVCVTVDRVKVRIINC